MISAFIFSQILVGIAFLLDLASFQFKKRKTTLLVFAAASTLVSIHFFILGAVTAGAVVLVSVIRLLTAYFTTDRRLMYLFIVLMVGLGVYTFDGLEDVFITLGVISATIGSFMIDGRQLRHFYILGATLAIVHHALVVSPVAILHEIFFLASNGISYWRFYIRKKDKTDGV